MFGLILILLLFGAVLAALLWAGTLWLQGYLYSEPAGDLAWRAPAAAAVLTAFLGLLCLLAYRHLGTIDPLSFSAKEEKVYNSFAAVTAGNKPVRYERHNTGSLLSGNEYIDRVSGRKWRRTDAEGRLIETIIVEEGPDKKEVRFELQRPSGGGFKENEVARYVEKGGRRVMLENDIGRVTTQRGWLVVLYLLLNLVHLAMWFLCLWLLLRFQWPHALGLAVVFCLVMTFLIVPMVLRRAEEVAPPRAPLTARGGVELDRTETR